MAIEDSSSSSIFAPWPDRLRHSAIILLAAGLALCALVVLADLSPARAVAVFVCIAAAALVPWRLHHLAAPPDDPPALPPGGAAALNPRLSRLPGPARPPRPPRPRLPPH